MTMSPSVVLVQVRWGKQRLDLSRRPRVERALRERERNRAKAEQAIELERVGRFFCEDFEMPADGADVAARDRASQAARRAQPLDSRSCSPGGATIRAWSSWR